MSLTELIAPLYNSKELQQLGLEEKAVKVLNKFIDARGEYISLSEARHNFKTITSQDVFAIVTELESIGYLIGKLDKGRQVYKFNDTSARTAVAVPLDKIKAEQKRFEERLSKKIERAAKTIEKYKNLGSLVEVVKEEPDKTSEQIKLERDFLLNKQEYIPQSSSAKSAKELHESQECDSKFCRFCAFEQNKEF